MTQREAADSLKWVPGYVAIVERDDYAALLRPSFARGYVKAFGRLLELDQPALMAAFDALEYRGEHVEEEKNAAPSVAVHLEKTGLGVVVGLSSLGLLIAALWWWQGNT